MKHATRTVLIVLSVCIFSFSLTGCKRRSSEGTSPVSDSVVTIDIINGMPEIQVLEEFNDESVSVEESEGVSVEANLGIFTLPTAKQIQAALKKAGYYNAKIDGKIGPKSQQAIRDFQRDNRLKVDGKVGKRTWSKLKKHLNH